MTFLCIIPARYHSRRLPGKVLIPVHGKPLLYWTLHSCLKSRSCERTIVATDSQIIAKAVASWGRKAVLTSKKCRNGTERVAEVADQERASYYINVQADHPFFPPSLLEEFCAWLKKEEPEVATIVTPLREEEKDNPAAVKTLLSADGRCLYFSRYPLPFSREKKKVLRLKHIGIYAYRRRVLKLYPRLSVPEYEKAESLEQLRFLAHNIPIYAWKTKHSVFSVDQPADLDKLKAKKISSLLPDV